MTSLVTLDEAKAHLRVDGDDEDTLIVLYLEMATDVVLNYVTQAEDDWTDSAGENPAPGVIRIAILLALGGIYQRRGGTSDSTSAVLDYYLSDPVKNLLARYRDPALA